MLVSEAGARKDDGGWPRVRGVDRDAGRHEADRARLQGKGRIDARPQVESR